MADLTPDYHPIKSNADYWLENLAKATVEAAVHVLRDASDDARDDFADGSGALANAGLNTSAAICAVAHAWLTDMCGGPFFGDDDYDSASDDANEYLAESDCSTTAPEDLGMWSLYVLWAVAMARINKEKTDASQSPAP